MKKKARAKKRKGLRLPALPVAALVLAVVGFMLRDYSSQRLGLLGAYIWLGALLISFLIGLTTIAQFILPGGIQRWQDALSLLLQHFSTTLGREPRPTARRTVASAEPAGLSPSFQQLRAGVVESHQALALTKGASFSRAVGPGFVRLKSGEAMGQAIELRQQFRLQEVQATTRDGIPIDTTVSVLFHVRRLPFDVAEPKLPYAFDSEAIFQVSYAGSVAEGKEPPAWSENVAPQAAAELVAEMARYTLDELYQAEEPHVTRLEQIRNRLKRKLMEAFAPAGIEIVDVNVSLLELPADVAEQRINNWRALWQRQIQMQQATADAAAIRRLTIARARAQMEIVENITDNIETMRRAGHTDLTEIITLRMIEAMETAIADDKVQALLPQQVMNTLNQMTALIGQPAADSQEPNSSRE